MRSIALLVLAAACTSSPANVAGNYSVAVTNRTDMCGINWMVGGQATGVQVTITQSGGNATAIVMGGGGVGLDILLGVNALTGTVSGDNVDLRATGTATHMAGNCTYTLNGEIRGTLSGDALMGTIQYTGQGNGASACAGITGCVSSQDFSGTRPPA
jgi:hypothetical protein